MYCTIYHLPSITTTARFLYINGYELIAEKEEFVAFPLRVENKHLSLDEIAEWLKGHVKKT